MSSSSLKTRTCVAALLTFALAHVASAQIPKPLPQLDDTKITGAFYQIARYPDKREKRCVGDSYEMVARGDKLNTLLLVDSCKTKGSYNEVRNITAKRQYKTVTDGRFKITTLYPFSHKYWILATSSTFDWYLSGTPDHKNLWIYAKTTTLSPEILAQIETIAASNGYPSARLTMTPQTTTITR
jgi:apolipoprotein D and lipocalin family protein